MFSLQEYAQAMHGRKIDQILQPTLVDPASIGDATVLDFRIAGSSSVLLNGEVSLPLCLHARDTR